MIRYLETPEGKKVDRGDPSANDYGAAECQCCGLWFAVRNGNDPTVKSLTAERDALRADAERLDWLDKECSQQGGRTFVACIPGHLRQAIDAARGKDA